MNLHNHNSSPSASLLCKCGRRGTIGEDVSGLWAGRSYICPDCYHHEHSRPLTSDEYYEQFNRIK